MTDGNASVETLQAELQLARLKVYRLERKVEELNNILAFWACQRAEEASKREAQVVREGLLR